jgi:hypothetical protein
MSGMNTTTLVSRGVSACNVTAAVTASAVTAVGVTAAASCTTKISARLFDFRRELRVEPLLPVRMTARLLLLLLLLLLRTVCMCSSDS